MKLRYHLFFVVVVLGLLSITLLSTVRSADIGGIEIQEVMYNPSGSDTGYEYVALFNTKYTPVDISGYELDAADLPYYTLSEPMIMPPRSILTIRFRASHCDEQEICTGEDFGSSNMSNTRGMVALFSGSDHSVNEMVDYMEYGSPGQTHEAKAVEGVLWGDGEYVEGVVEGQVIYRTCEDHLPECFSGGVQGSGIGAMQNDVWNALLVVGEEVASDVSILLGEQMEVVHSSGSLLTTTLDEGPTMESAEENPSWDLGLGDHTIVYISSSGSVLLPQQQHNIYVANIPIIQITELAFRESESDYVEMLVKDDGSDGRGIPLSLLSLHLDDTSYVLPSQYVIHTGDRVIFTFGPGEMVAGGIRLDDVLLDDGNGTLWVATRDEVALDGICWESQTGSSSQDTSMIQFLNDMRKDACVSSDIQDGNIYHDILKDGGEHYWLALPYGTPGEETNFVNAPPVAHITVQSGATMGAAPLFIDVGGGDSSDDLGIVAYHWDFGDGETYEGKDPEGHTYVSTGTYMMTLIVEDSFGATSQDSFEVTVGESTIQRNSTTEPSCTSSEYNGLEITELFPNPSGSDTDKEWVELYNNSSEDIVLCDVYLADEQDSQSLEGTTIAGHSYYVIEGKELHIVLNNAADTLRLLHGEDILQEVHYENAPTDKSYSFLYNNT